MIYLVDDKKYSFSYQELREEINLVLEMTDDEFLDNIPKILHIACFACYIKEIPTYLCLSDEGIIHQLVHLLHLTDFIYDLKEIRKLFELTCKLH